MNAYSGAEQISGFMPCRSGGIGRRAWFRSMCPQGRGGSSPFFGTKFVLNASNHNFFHLTILSRNGSVSPTMRPKQNKSAVAAVSKAEMQRLLADSAFIRHYGFRVHSLRRGECVVHVPFQREFERPGGIVSGLLFMAAADVAMWLAIKTILGSDDGSVTVEMKTNFLAAAKEQDFRCRARILKLGKRLIYGTAECVSLDRQLLAHHTLTYIRPGDDRR
jgi:uncharacterized protein (TIGR00369 family)